LARLERTAHPEVVEVYRAGKLSVRNIKAFVRLTPRQQLAELRRRQDAKLRYSENCQRVAGIISEYLSNCQTARPDLRQLQALLKA
jgi:hypothetical protein